MCAKTKASLHCACAKHHRSMQTLSRSDMILPRSRSQALLISSRIRLCNTIFSWFVVPHFSIDELAGKSEQKVNLWVFKCSLVTTCFECIFAVLVLWYWNTFKHRAAKCNKHQRYYNLAKIISFPSTEYYNYRLYWNWIVELVSHRNFSWGILKFDA